MKRLTDCSLVQVYINTLLLQRVLDDPKWTSPLAGADRRAPSVLLWTNVNPYGVLPNPQVLRGPDVTGALLMDCSRVDRRQRVQMLGR